MEFLFSQGVSKQDPGDGLLRMVQPLSKAIESKGMWIERGTRVSKVAGTQESVQTKHADIGIQESRGSRACDREKDGRVNGCMEGNG